MTTQSYTQMPYGAWERSGRLISTGIGNVSRKKKSLGAKTCRKERKILEPRGGV